MSFSRAEPENFRKFSKNFSRTLLKMHYFSVFFKKFKNPALIFRAFGQKHKLLWNFEKIFDENSIEKLHFLIIFGKLVTKNRAFGNNPIFLQEFFRIRGGGENLPHFPPLNPPMHAIYISFSLYIKGPFDCQFHFENTTNKRQTE